MTPQELGEVVHDAASHVQTLFECLPDFRQLLEIHDPYGKFRNAFVDEYVFQR